MSTAIRSLRIAIGGVELKGEVTDVRINGVSITKPRGVGPSWSRSPITPSPVRVNAPRYAVEVLNAAMKGNHRA